MKPCADLYIFIFGGREFQTNDPDAIHIIIEGKKILNRNDC